MAENSSIEWTDTTWNPVTGCTRVSAGCDHCYAVQMTNRLEAMGQTEKYGGLTVLNRSGERHFNGKIRTHDDALKIPLGWKKPRRVFVNSMSDLFHRDVPFEFIDKVFAVMALTPQHTYQVLTKRPERMAKYLNTPSRAAAMQDAVDHWEADDDFPFGDVHAPLIRQRIPFDNVWLGTSVEDQKAADERIPHLLKCPAAVRFLSCEPLLGPVNLRVRVPNVKCAHPTCGHEFNEDDAAHGEQGWECPKCGRDEFNDSIDYAKGAGINWCIVGGESGPGARPMNVEWARSLVQQCKAAAVPCFVKQLGGVPVMGADEWKRRSEVGPVPLLDHRRHRELEAMGYVRLHLEDSKGGDPSEWPADLRVREFPKV